MEILRDNYLKRLTLFQQDFKETEKKIKIISIARLTIAISMILCFYYGLTQNLSLFYLFFALLICFVILVIVHNNFFLKKNLLINYIRINKEELEALNGNHHSFLKGELYLDHQHSYAYDLDVFGENSLFQFLCRTTTEYGKEKLASLLITPPTESLSIQKRQEAITELKTQIDFRQTFRAKGLFLTENKSDITSLLNWLKSDNHFTSPVLFWLSFILPVVTIGAVLYSITNKEWSSFLSAALLINTLVYGLYGKKINNLHAAVSRKKNTLDVYSELILLIEKSSCSSALLTYYQKKGSDASAELKKIANYTSWLDNRLNILYSPFANLFFLHDIHFCIMIEKWKIRNKDKVASWLDSIGEFDCLNSIANMAYNHPNTITPNIVEADSPILKTKELIHPLMSNKNAVPNDFEIGKDYQTVILTGANMAGKSTFLRSLGVNLILAYSGAPVFAHSFNASLMFLASTMRISDSLKDNTSYFYAELQRLKQIKEKLVSGTHCFILLDEILKGTNSNDKQKGSKAFVENLINYPCLGMVATHDLELGILQTQYTDKVKNFCFESFITNNELTFDYKIREGLAQNTNASFLRKELGSI